MMRGNTPTYQLTNHFFQKLKIMNAYEILEEQGFLQSLSNTNRIIYLRINSSNLLRSWIIFYSFCLKNEAIRYRVQRFDYTPVDARAFKFRHPYNVYGLEGIPIAHARALWKKLRCTLHSPYFEVFRTPSMGLGLRSHGSRFLRLYI